MTRTAQIDFINAARKNAPAKHDAKYVMLLARYEAMTDAEFDAMQDCADEKAAQHASDHTRYSSADATRGRW